MTTYTGKVTDSAGQSVTRTVDVAVASSKPGPGNTGIPAGTVLTVVNGNLSSSANGQIIDSKDVRGEIVVSHANVTIRKCKATHIGFDVAGAINGTVEDSEVTCGPNGGGSAISTSANGMIVRRCNIHSFENGVFIGNNSKNHSVTGNWIHDPAPGSNPDPHTDGIQFFAGHTGCNISGNTIDVDKDGSNSCVTMKDCNNNVFDGNWLYQTIQGTGAYNFYFEGSSSGNRVTNNRVGRNKRVNGTNAVAQIYSGNVDDVTGQPINWPS